MHRINHLRKSIDGFRVMADLTKKKIVDEFRRLDMAQNAIDKAYNEIEIILKENENE
jgi:hypothetical protein